MTEPRRRHASSGQVTPLVLVALLFAALLAAGVAHVGTAAAARASAQAAADASALAAAAAGEPAATEVAAANRASVVSYERVGDDVEVIVERGGVSATARARWAPVAIP